MTATLILIRHGEIVRPTDTSNFDPAPLSPQGFRELEALAQAWPADPPSTVYASPLRRAIESAEVLSRHFGVAVLVRPCLREWAADVTGIPQTAYVALEARSWRDLDFLPPSGESLGMASRRARACLEAIASGHAGDTVAVAGHGTLFSLLTSELKGDRPTAAYKASVGFAHAAILEAGSDLRLVRDFAPYAVAPRDSKPL